MQRIMHILHDDHINVARLLDLMDSVLEEFSAGNASRLDVACSTMRYMTAYPDLFHHPTEDILFQQLLHRAAETQAKVEQLVSEHEAIGVAGNDLLHRLKKTIQHDSEPSPGLIKSGKGYVTQLRAHMNTEEGEIFPLTKVVLTHRDWEDLHEKIDSTGDPLFGPKVQRSYQDLARALTTQ